jgi:hypothetical protein
MQPLQKDFPSTGEPGHCVYRPWFGFNPLQRLGLHVVKGRAIEGFMDTTFFFPSPFFNEIVTESTPRRINASSPLKPYCSLHDITALRIASLYSDDTLFRHDALIDIDIDIDIDDDDIFLMELYYFGTSHHQPLNYFNFFFTPLF